MIRDYLRGKRVHYYKPFQTLFVLAALYIMGVQLIDPTAIKLSEKEMEEEPTIASLMDDIKYQQEQTSDSCTKYYLGQSITYADSDGGLKPTVYQNQYKHKSMQNSAIKTKMS